MPWNASSAYKYSSRSLAAFVSSLHPSHHTERNQNLLLLLLLSSQLSTTTTNKTTNQPIKQQTWASSLASLVASDLADLDLGLGPDPRPTPPQTSWALDPDQATVQAWPTDQEGSLWSDRSWTSMNPHGNSTKA